MAQTITFEYDGQKYELEYTRATVRQMENSGFNIAEIDSKPVTRIPQLWSGAFICHHRKLTQEKINEIYKHMARKDELIEKLATMYYEAISTLVDDDVEDDDPKKVDW